MKNNITIHYAQKWSQDGTHYNQIITICTTSEELTAINESFAEIRTTAKKMRRWGALPSGSPLDLLAMYARDVAPGLNFPTISTAEFLAGWFGLKQNKRYLTGRNTAFNFIAR